MQPTASAHTIAATGQLPAVCRVSAWAWSWVRSGRSSSGRTANTWARRGLIVIGLLLGVLTLAGCQTDLPLNDLKARHGGPSSRFLPMDGMDVHWRDEGPADASQPLAILLLHGTASSLHTWDGWARELSREFRVVRLDLPGFGLTGPHPSGDYSPAAMIDFLERFADAAGLQNMVVAGNSLGGLYAWRFALRHPQRTRGLVLIDAAGYPSDLSGPGTLGLRLARTPVVSELMRWAPVDSMVGGGLRGAYADPRKVTPETIDRYASLMRRPGNRAALGDRARAQTSATGWEQVQNIRTPTLILWGGRDTWLPPVMGERFKRDIPGSRLVIYPELGHVPMEEDPANTVGDLRAFLRELSRGTPDGPPR